MARHAVGEILVEGTSEIRNWIVIAGAANRQGNHGRLLSRSIAPSTGVGCAMGFAYWDLS